MIKAQRELRDLKQRNREFYLYFADFQRIIEDTGITDNEARKSALIGGLSTELLSLLVHHDVPVKFDDLVKLLQGLDSRYRLNRNRTQGFQFSRPQLRSSRYNRPISRAYIPSRPSISPSIASTRQKLSPEELKRRTKEGLCRYYEESGHYVKDCPRSASSSTKTLRKQLPRGLGYKLGSSLKEFKEDLRLPAGTSLPTNLKNDKSLF